MKKTFLPQLHPTNLLNQPALWFIFKKEEVLVYKTTNGTTIPRLANIEILNLSIQRQYYLGVYDTTPCYVAEISNTETTLLPDMVFQTLRNSSELDNREDLFLIASRAKQILNWDKATQFCGHCGSKTTHSDKERAKVCAHCNELFYPTIAPVVLALIWRKNEILLARSPHFQKDVYSILAGFVEPGEALEHTVIREVREEVGIDIKNLSYCGSQPWPFPSNLMLGFTAEYAAGEIVMEPIEIEDAQWFALDKLPLLPSSTSLSRRMIDKFIEEKRTY